MSEMTATRTTRRSHKTLALVVGAAAWLVGAWLLTRTSVPSLHLSGVDEHTLFSERALQRAARYSRGAELLWLGGTIASLGALVVLVWRLPPSIRSMGLGRIASAIVGGMVIFVTLWFVALPFGLASLWWDHHYGLGPFDVIAWLDSQWALLAAEVGSVMLGIVLLVGFAGRWPRGWWLAAAPTIVAIAAAVRVRGRLARGLRCAPAGRSGAPGGRHAPRAGRRSRRAHRSASWTSRRGRTRRMRSPPVSVPRPTSFSGTRCSTGASRVARSTW